MTVAPEALAERVKPFELQHLHTLDKGTSPLGQVHLSVQADRRAAAKFFADETNMGSHAQGTWKSTLAAARSRYVRSNVERPYENVFLERPDYRLLVWASYLSGRYQPDEFVETAIHGLEHPAAVVQHGTAWVIAREITKNPRGAGGRKTVQEPFGSREKRLWEASIRWLEGWRRRDGAGLNESQRVEAAVARVGLRDAVQWREFKTRAATGPDVANLPKALDGMEIDLRQMDSEWEPGRTVDLRRTLIRRRDSLLPASFMELCWMLAASLTRVRPRWSPVLCDLREREAISVEARRLALFATTAWLQLRWCRMGEERFQEGVYEAIADAEETVGWSTELQRKLTMEHRAAIRLDGLIRGEEMRLRDAAYAAFQSWEQAGDVDAQGAAAGLASLLFLSVTDERVDEFRGAASNLLTLVRQYGLQIDDRFRTGKPPARSFAAAPASSSEQATFAGGAALEHRSIVNATAAPPIDSSASVAECPVDDEALAGRWGHFMQFLGERGEKRWSLGVKRLLRTDPHSLDDEAASWQRYALQVAAGQGLVSDCSTAIWHGVLPREPMTALNYMYAVKRALQVMPMLSDPRARGAWLATLRKAARAWIAEYSTADVVALHETLAGGLSVPLAAIGSGELRRDLLAHWRGLDSQRDLRSLIDSLNPRYGLRGPGRIDVKNTGRVAAQLEKLYGREVQVLSLRRLDDGQWSIVQVERDPEHGGRYWVKTAETRWSDELVELAEAQVLAPALETGVPLPLVPPDVPEMAQIVEDLRALSAGGGEKARIIFFTVLGATSSRPDLFAGVPWGQILRLYGRQAADPDVVVQIPSISWLGWLLTQRLRYGSVGMSGEPVWRGLLEVDTGDLAGDEHVARIKSDLLVREQKGADVESRSLLYALGHGTYDAGSGMRSLATSATGGPVTVRDWLDLGSRTSHAILHVCRSGELPSELVGDPGGLPGLLLGCGVDSVCAPVCPVNAGTAWRLHKELFDQSSEAGFLDRYLAAWRADRSVGYYTLYGLPVAEWKCPSQVCMQGSPSSGRG